MTKEKRNKLINFGFISVSILVVIVIAFSNSELTDAWHVLFTMNPWCLAGCLAGFLAYVGFDGVGIFAYLRHAGYRVSLGSAIHLSFAGIYYANVTPGSSGGQPMQVYMMRQRNIPVGIATTTLTVKFFATQLVMVLATALLWLTNLDFCREQLGGVNMVIVLGWVINACAVPLILLVAFNRSLVARCAAWLIRVATRFHWCKHPEEVSTKVERVLDNYHTAIRELLRHPWHVVLQVVIGAAEMFSLMSVTVCVYYAFDMTGVSAGELLAVAFMLFVSASYTPLPGASGAQEGGFLLFYRGIFTGGTISIALLVWRFFTYYIFLLLGVIDTVITALRRRPALITHVDEPEITD